MDNNFHTVCQGTFLQTFCVFSGTKINLHTSISEVNTLFVPPLRMIKTNLIKMKSKGNAMVQIDNTLKENELATLL
jgi:hypothetical protein